MASSRINRSHRPAGIVFGLILTGVLAACGGNQNQAASSSTPSATAKSTVEFRDSGAKGKVLVAGSTQMTVYNFTKDTVDSGKSSCTGACLTKWPALTVSGGTTPAAGAGVSGKLGTFVRTDDNTTQVTYDGLPLYFFSNDKAPGDTNGDYQNWLLIKPSS